MNRWDAYRKRIEDIGCDCDSGGGYYIWQLEESTGIPIAENEIFEAEGRFFLVELFHSEWCACLGDRLPL